MLAAFASKYSSNFGQRLTGLGKCRLACSFIAHHLALFCAHERRLPEQRRNKHGQRVGLVLGSQLVIVRCEYMLLDLLLGNAEDFGRPLSRNWRNPGPLGSAAGSDLRQGQLPGGGHCTGAPPVPLPARLPEPDCRPDFMHVFRLEVGRADHAVTRMPLTGLRRREHFYGRFGSQQPVASREAWRDNR